MKEREVMGALQGSGFTEADARCLAARAARSLSIRQLRQLEAAAAAMDKPVREMEIGVAMDGLRNTVDSETAQLVGTLVVDCVRARIGESRS